MAVHQVRVETDEDKRPHHYEEGVLRGKDFPEAAGHAVHVDEARVAKEALLVQEDEHREENQAADEDEVQRENVERLRVPQRDT